MRGSTEAVILHGLMVAIKRCLYLLFAAVPVAWLMLLNVRAHRPDDLAVTVAQLRFLGDALDEGAAVRMQQMFPEGYVFTWALTGLASAQVAAQLEEHDPRREELLGLTRRAVSEVDSAPARSTFNPDLDPPYGAFYVAWSAYLSGELIRTAGPEGVAPQLIERFEENCAAFAGALQRSESPFLASYPGAAWPADAAVGIAALGLHDRLLPARFRPIIERWVAAARMRLDELGALSHAADAETGAPGGGVRGSSLALMTRVLVEADPELSRAQFEILRRHFVDYRWGVPGVREYPHGHRGAGDVDSGPLFLGYSGSAVVVGAAAARVHGDERLARALLGAVEVGGLPFQWGGKRRYGGGLVPVGDAFIAWARSSVPRAEFDGAEWESQIPGWWALPAHLLSAVLAGLVLLPAFRWLRSRCSPATSLPPLASA